MAIKIALLYALLNVVDTLAYSIRLNSLKNGQFALSASLFNTISLVTRTASVFLLPAIGILVGYGEHHPETVVSPMRLILFGATIGSCIGAIFIPTFLKLFGKAVNRLELTGSIPGLLIQSLTIANIKMISHSATMPHRRLLEGLRFREIPKRLLLMNMFITGVFTVGILSANFAALLVPARHSLAAAQSSGMITGIATILLSLFIDPKTAVMTDQALRGQRSYGDVKALVTLLVATKIAGTILAQFLLIPSADFLAYFYG